MTEVDAKHAPTICEIAGCTGPATAPRWVVTATNGKRRIEVCRKHEIGDIDPNTIEGPR